MTARTITVCDNCHHTLGQHGPLRCDVSYCICTYYVHVGPALPNDAEPDRDLPELADAPRGLDGPAPALPAEPAPHEHHYGPTQPPAGLGWRCCLTCGTPEPAEPAGARCNCPESGTSGSCPFHDASTLAEPAGAGLREAAQDVVDRSPIDVDGETSDEWCHYCQSFSESKHEAGCEWAALRAARRAATPVGEEEG